MPKPRRKTKPKLELVQATGDDVAKYGGDRPATPRGFMRMQHDKDPKQVLLEKLGDLSKIDICNLQVMAAVYIRPDKLVSGLYVTNQTQDEDKYQGKVGLIVKLGPHAFNDETGKWFGSLTFEMHDWIVFRPSDGWSITINGVLCRMLEDNLIKGRVPSPDMVW